MSVRYEIQVWDPVHRRYHTLTDNRSHDWACIAAQKSYNRKHGSSRVVKVERTVVCKFRKEGMHP